TMYTRPSPPPWRSDRRSKVVASTMSMSVTVVWPSPPLPTSIASSAVIEVMCVPAATSGELVRRRMMPLPLPLPLPPPPSLPLPPLPPPPLPSLPLPPPPPPQPGAGMQSSSVNRCILWFGGHNTVAASHASATAAHAWTPSPVDVQSTLTPSTRMPLVW